MPMVSAATPNCSSTAINKMKMTKPPV